MAETTDNVDYAFIGRQLEKVLTEMKAMRRDVATAVTAATTNLEYSRRIERRMGEGDQRMAQLGQRIDELKDDVGAILKIEIGGALANLQTRLDERFEKIEDSLASLSKENPRHE